MAMDAAGVERDAYDHAGLLLGWLHATSQPLRVREASLLGSILGWPAA
jgi:hypothetical protein